MPVMAHAAHASRCAMATTPNPAPTSASSCPTPGCPTAAPSSRRRATTSTSPSPCGLNPAFRSPKATPRGRCTSPSCHSMLGGSGPAKLGSGRSSPLRGRGRRALARQRAHRDRRLARLRPASEVQSGPSGRGSFRFGIARPRKANYVKETFDNGQQTRHFATLLEPSAYLKLGIYRDGRFTRTGVLSVDRIKVAERFASVAIPPGA